MKKPFLTAFWIVFWIAAFSVSFWSVTNGSRRYSATRSSSDSQAAPRTAGSQSSPPAQLLTEAERLEIREKFEAFQRAKSGAVEVFVVREFGDGGKRSDVSVELAEMIGRHLESEFEEKLSNNAGTYPPIGPISVSSESLVLEIDGVPLMINHLSRDGVRLSTQVSTIMGTEYVRVMCISTSGALPSMYSGKCASTVESTFDVTFTESPQ